MENSKLMTITKRCESCKRVYNFKVSVIGYNAWRNGTLIQRALPELAPDLRELLISDMCGTCFSKIFKEID